MSVTLGRRTWPDLSEGVGGIYMIEERYLRRSYPGKGQIVQGSRAGQENECSWDVSA